MTIDFWIGFLIGGIAGILILQKTQDYLNK
jgi:hypothetical protein